MSKESFFYCPILQRKIKVNNLIQNNRQSFGMSEKSGFCKMNCKECFGNSVGCNIL